MEYSGWRGVLQIDVVNVQEQARQMMHLHMIVENGCEWMGGHWQKEQDADGANSCAVGQCIVWVD